MGSELSVYVRRTKILLFIVVLICMIVFIWKTDFQSIKHTLANIGFKFFYLLIITYLAYFFGTWSWHVTLKKNRSKISILQLFSIRQVGETVGQYNPTSIIGGDLLKAQMLGRYHIDQLSAIESVATARITAVLSQILIFLFACIYLLYNNSSLINSRYGYVFCGLFILLIFLKVYFFIWISKKKNQSNLPKELTKPNVLQTLIQKSKGLLFNISQTYQNDPKSFWYSYLLAAIHWLIGSLEFYLILIFLGFNVSVIQGVLLDMSVIVFKSFAAFIPGQLGIEELGNKIMLALIGIHSATAWITVSILRRARQIIWIGIGFILYFFIKKDVQHATFKA